MTSEADDHEGRAAAMELVIGSLMANYCRDPAHPTLDEMRLVNAEVVAILKAVRGSRSIPSTKQDYRSEQPQR